MRIVISTKYLAQQLSSINFEEESVTHIISEKHKIIFCTEKQQIELECDVDDFKSLMEQSEVNWDWVKQLMNEVSEQPAVMLLFEDSVNIVFSY